MPLISGRAEKLSSVDLKWVKQEMIARLRAVVPNQEHVMAHWDRLDEIAQAKLATQIDDIDFELLMTPDPSEDRSQDYADSLQPPSVITLEEQSASQTATLEGEHCISQGRVGVMLVAGGMGTRLGFGQPKGMLPLGPVSGNSLIQIMIERIVALGIRYGVRIPLYLMTSEFTHHSTIRFLIENDLFGLPKEDLAIFCQGTLPAICAKTRRLLMTSPGVLAGCPDGPGGMLTAAWHHGCFDDMEKRGIDVLFYGQMDNPLLNIADPHLIGHHLIADADITTQVVKRSNSAERCSLYVAQGPRIWPLKYHAIPQGIAAATDDDGAPLYWARSTGTHAYRVSFLRRISTHKNALPAIPCRRSVPNIDELGKQQLPNELNAITFERFVDDLRHYTCQTLLVEADRETKFAPVKYPDFMKAETFTAARTAMVKLHTNWLVDAGTKVASGIAVEISPLFALDGADIVDKVSIESIVTPTYFS